MVGSMAQCWTCSGNHEEQDCPHRVGSQKDLFEGVVSLQAAAPLVTSSVGSSSYQLQDHTVGEYSPLAQARRSQVRQSESGGTLAPRDEDSDLGLQSNGSRSPTGLSEEPSPPRLLLALLGKHAGPEKLSVQVLKATLLELLWARPALWAAAVFGFLGLLLAVAALPWRSPVLAGGLALATGTGYLRAASWRRRRRRGGAAGGLPGPLLQPEAWRFIFYALWVLPAMLETAGLYGLLAQATRPAPGGGGGEGGGGGGGAGAGASRFFPLALAAGSALATLASLPALRRAARRGPRGLKKWRAFSGCLKAAAALALLGRAALVGDARAAAGAARALLLFLSAVLFRAGAGPRALARAARGGACRALRQAGRDLSAELSGETCLQLALLRWLVDAWARPRPPGGGGGEDRGGAFAGELAAALAGMKAEVDRSAVPALERLHRTLSRADVDGRAKPLAAAARAAVARARPRAGPAQWCLVAGRLPAAAAFLLLAVGEGRVPWALLPLAATEVWLVHRLLKDLQARAAAAAAEERGLDTEENQDEFEEDGMAILLWGSGYDGALLPVWQNLRWAVERGLPASVTALRGYQAAARGYGVGRGVLRLAEVSARISAEGWGYGAAFALKEAMSLVRGAEDGGGGGGGGEGSLVRQLAEDSAALARHGYALYQEGEVGRAVAPALRYTQDTAWGALGYAGAALGYLDPRGYALPWGGDGGGGEGGGGDGDGGDGGSDGGRNLIEAAGGRSEALGGEGAGGVAAPPEGGGDAEGEGPEAVVEAGAEAGGGEGYAAAALAWLNPWSYWVLQPATAAAVLPAGAVPGGGAEARSGAGSANGVANEEPGTDGSSPSQLRRRRAERGVSYSAFAETGRDHQDCPDASVQDGNTSDSEGLAFELPAVSGVVNFQSEEEGPLVANSMPESVAGNVLEEEEQIVARGTDTVPNRNSELEEELEIVQSARASSPEVIRQDLHPEEVRIEDVPEAEHWQGQEQTDDETNYLLVETGSGRARMNLSETFSASTSGASSPPHQDMNESREQGESKQVNEPDGNSNNLNDAESLPPEEIAALAAEVAAAEARGVLAPAEARSLVGLLARAAHPPPSPAGGGEGEGGGGGGGGVGGDGGGGGGGGGVGGRAMAAVVRRQLEVLNDVSMILSRRNSEEEEDLVEGEEETDRLPRSGDAKQGLGQAEAARSPEGPEAGETKLAAASSGGGVLGGLTASLSFLGQAAAFRSPQAYALEKLTGFYYGSGEAIGAGGTEEEGMTGGQVGESKGGEERQKEHTQQYQTPV